MLLRLTLKDFVIVDQLEIDFSAGFSALTGETGAGKSILLDALSLALGERADPAFVREGCSRAEVSAEFSIDAALEHWLADKDLGGDPGTVLLRRLLDLEGKSRAYINGAQVTVGTLRELGAQLLEIHGQHASQALLKPAGQRELLDRYAGCDGPQGELTPVRQAWRELHRLETALAEAEKGEREIALQREALLWQLAELAELKPQPGEWEQLGEEQKRLAHARALIEGSQQASEALSQGDEALADRLSVIVQRLSPLVQVDPRLKDALELLQSAQIQLDEAASSLGHYAERLDLDPERLQDVEARVSAMHAAARKLKQPAEQLPQLWLSLQQRLQQLEDSADLARLKQRITQAQADYRAKAAALTKKRKAAAKSLSDGVSSILPTLGMSGATLQVSLSAQPGSENGSDAIEFLFAGHAAAAPRALSRVASGGELSRVSLAVAVLAARANPVPSLIFDEADAGVGGAVAAVIGKLMRQLGQDRQVFCVTHLPQVAALAHQQYRVSKSSVGPSTRSRVDLLSKNERIDEIARMLGGEDITANTRKLARELLA